MKYRNLYFALLLAFVTASASWSFYKPNPAGVDMTVAAERFVESLDAKQRETTLLPYDSPTRFEWHFIPKEYRKGLQIKHMTDDQRKLAHNLLRSSLSEMGYTKATQIMELETLLNHLEMGKGRFARDPYRYYFTLFGTPQKQGRWGLSVEGHHLSFNYVVEDSKIISSTPQFFAANPAELKEDYLPAFKKGMRVLAKEEQLAFDLVNALDKEQAKVAILDPTAPKEIRAAGEAQPPTDAAVGLSADKLAKPEQKLLRELINEYAQAMPEVVATQRLTAIEKAGFEKIHFAWAGATKPGIGHYYRIQGPTFLIEFVNTQPDAAGNPANHIHCVWRDMHGDFAVPIKQ